MRMKLPLVTMATARHRVRRVRGVLVRPRLRIWARGARQIVSFRDSNRQKVDILRSREGEGASCRPEREAAWSGGVTVIDRLTSLPQGL